MKHNNTRKESRLLDFPQNCIEQVYDNVKGLTSFNFNYFDSNNGDKFEDLSKEQIVKIINKIRDFSKESCDHWKSARIGNKDGRVLVVYGDFPKNSKLKNPKHVPIGVKWARFRMEGDQRLAGFFIEPKDIRDNVTNVFYIVYLDLNHRFYVSDR